VAGSNSNLGYGTIAGGMPCSRWAALRREAGVKTGHVDAWLEKLDEHPPDAGGGEEVVLTFVLLDRGRGGLHTALSARRAAHPVPSRAHPARPCYSTGDQP
jgi:hypothetical protein